MRPSVNRKDRQGTHLGQHDDFTGLNIHMLILMNDE